MKAPEVQVREVVHESGRVLRYVVTCGRFAADLPACTRDECASGDIAGSLKECTVRVDSRGQHAIALSKGRTSKSVDAWLKHIHTHCHGYHRARVEAFAASVARTYGWKAPTVAALLRKVSPDRSAGWPSNWLREERDIELYREAS